MFFKKSHFSQPEEDKIVAAIQEAERDCFGEIRVYVESAVGKENVYARAVEIFKFLKIDQTEFRNGVLIYIAKEDRRFAVIGDQGIHEKVGNKFWSHQASHLRTEFERGHFAEGVSHTIKIIGEKLKEFFPRTDCTVKKNELPDAPVYGK